MCFHGNPVVTLIRGEEFARKENLLTGTAYNTGVWGD